MRSLKRYALYLAVGSFWLTGLFGGVAFTQPAVMDCSLCHLSGTPTKENPLLKYCPRPSMMVTSASDAGPDVVIMDELENLYVPVRFNHAMHAKMAGIQGGCVQCHHFTKPGEDIQSCKACHPVDIIHEDLSQPGLKGAYHRQCLNCHREWDEETSCEICHEKKEGGKLNGKATTVSFHRRYEPVLMDELITFQTESDNVPFHHKRHAEMYTRDCNSCHQQQSCSQCHLHNSDTAMAKLHPMGDLNQVDLHDVCFRCHEEDACEKCHGQNPDTVFSHSQTGWELKAYHQTLHCQDCHKQNGKFQKLNRDCSSCHISEWEPKDFHHQTTGVELDELHVEEGCADCHTKGFGSPAACDGCHDDNRKYDPVRGFKPKEEQ